MRIPPLYQKATWQRFFVGVVIGALISWFVFLYMHGVLQEKQINKIHKQSQTIHEMSNKIEIWEKDYNRLNKEAEKKLLIEDVKVVVLNGKQYHLDLLSVAEAEEVIEEDLTSLIAKEVETVYKSKTLLKKSIENKTIEINKKRYRLEVVEIFFYTTMNIEVKLHRQ
ncbi:sporulation membrane protein YtrI [Peribacillus loiseleuriae]|uniref:sporulation membrane protein YtrI n=1 Tax=Peribacillus loiseleuriae TaxID=1679170 RepID=UPI003D00781E